MSEKPFEHTRWDAPFEATEALLIRLLTKEGWTSLSPSTWTPEQDPEEIKYPHSVILALVVGHLQVAFPGYGVVELLPGDQLTIGPGILHDVTLASSSARVLQGIK